MPAPFSNVCQLKDYTCVMTTHYLMICLIIPESKFSSLTLIFYINHWIRKSCLVTSFVFNYKKVLDILASYMYSNEANQRICEV